MHPIDNILDKLHHVQRRTRVLLWFLATIRALLIAFVVASLWFIVHEGQIGAACMLGAISFVLALLATRGSHRIQPIQPKNMLFALEIADHSAKTSAFDLTKSDDLPDEWKAQIKTYENECRDRYRQNIAGFLSTLAIPALLTLVICLAQPHVLVAGGHQIVSLLDYFNRGASLKVVSGAVDAKDIGEIALSRSTLAEVNLLEENLVRVELKGFRARGGNLASPTIELREDNAAKTVFQTFQTDAMAEDSAVLQSFDLQFAVSKNLLLYIPAISSRPLAMFNVRKRPIPEVELTATQKITEPWPDDAPLHLNIKVKAKNPLQLVRLVVFSGKRRSEELVSRIVATDKLEFEQDYDLVLEPYVDADISQVEIVAEAIDRALPQPQLGQSPPIKLTTASAYGRYRQVLDSLRQAKTFIDEAVGENKSRLPADVMKPIEKAVADSANTPFFDGLDRSRISEIARLTEESVNTSDRSQILRLSETLNSFLFEHETLDDRERDRDFFVAARGFSRVMAMDKAKRPVDVEALAERMKNFLRERQFRWKVRTNYLDKSKLPAAWERYVNDREFETTMDRIGKMGENEKREPALSELSKMTTKYSNWIEALEKAEDTQRAEEQKKREEGLTSARNELKELQKVQDQISSILDRAETQGQEKIGENWPKARSMQNSNLAGTRKLEGQLRSLSPTASERIKFAVERMENVLKEGEEESFATAETQSDFASRLLRQAESAAQQSQKDERSRGRRRKLSGDNPYGSEILGRDIAIPYDYQVDRRYREDILDEIHDADSNQEDSQLLDNYLRRVVR